MTNENKTRSTVAALVISAATLVGIAANEGYVGEAYKDLAGIPTIGFGETSGVVMGQKTDPIRAMIQLEKSINIHAHGMAKCIRVPLTQGEYNAYLDFTYNVGVNAFCTSTLNKKLNAMDYDGACKELLRWDKVNGKPVLGLTRRRQAEYKQCIGD